MTILRGTNFFFSISTYIYISNTILFSECADKYWNFVSFTDQSEQALFLLHSRLLSRVTRIVAVICAKRKRETRCRHGVRSPRRRKDRCRGRIGRHFARTHSFYRRALHRSIMVGLPGCAYINNNCRTNNKAGGTTLDSPKLLVPLPVPATFYSLSSPRAGMAVVVPLVLLDGG